jgi:hypothetical protein
VDSLNDKFFSDEFCNAILENFINHRATAAELRAAGFEAHASEVVRETILGIIKENGSNLIAVRELAIPQRGKPQTSKKRPTCDVAVVAPPGTNPTWMPVEYVFEVKTNYKTQRDIKTRILGRYTKGKKGKPTWKCSAIEQANSYSGELGALQSGKYPRAFVAYIVVDPTPAPEEKPEHQPYDTYLDYTVGKRRKRDTPKDFLSKMEAFYKFSNKTVSFEAYGSPCTWDVTVTLIACDKIRTIRTDTPGEFGELQAC